MHDAEIVDSTIWLATSKGLQSMPFPTKKKYSKPFVFIGSQDPMVKHSSVFSREGKVAHRICSCQIGGSPNHVAKYIVAGETPMLLPDLTNALSITKLVNRSLRKIMEYITIWFPLCF